MEVDWGESVKMMMKLMMNRMRLVEVEAVEMVGEGEDGVEDEMKVNVMRDKNEDLDDWFHRWMIMWLVSFGMRLDYWLL